MGARTSSIGSRATITRAAGRSPSAIRSRAASVADDPPVDHPLLTSGRFPTGPRDAFLNEEAARRSGLKLGPRVQVTPADPSFSDFETVEVDLVGIGNSTVARRRGRATGSLVGREGFEPPKLSRLVYSQFPLATRAPTQR